MGVFDENYKGPQFQIGHHMIRFKYNENGGHKLGIPEVGSLTCLSPERSDEWMDMVIEYKPGKLLLTVNGHTEPMKTLNSMPKTLKTKRAFNLILRAKRTQRAV